MDLNVKVSEQKIQENLALRKGFKLDDVIVIPYKGEIRYNQKHYHLPPNSMRLLLFLTENNNKIISAESCLETVWGDKNKSKNVLSHAISDIRNVLHDHVECPEFIQTIPTKGYRLIANVSLLDSQVLYQKFSDNGEGETKAFESHWSQSFAIFKDSKLVKVSIAYIISTWAILQVADLLVPVFNLSEWWMKIIVLLLIASFPMVLILTWLKEIKVRRYLFAKYKTTESKKFFFSQISIDFTFISILSIIVGFLAFSIYEQVSNVENKKDTVVLSKKIDDKIVVVLPFHFSKDVKIANYYKSTLQGEIINAMSHQNKFNLISMRAVKEMKANSTVDAYINRFGARYMIEGDIEKRKKGIIVNLSILDTKSLVQIWSSQVVGASNDLLAMQKTINQKLFNAFQLIAKNKSISNFTINTNDFKSYDDYVHAKNLMSDSSDLKKLKESEKYFMSSLSSDPEFSLALAGLCQNLIDQFDISKNVEDFNSAKRYCKHLTKFENLKSDAYVALGDIDRIKGANDSAIAFYDKALSLKKMNSEALIGKSQSLKAKGDIASAEKLLLEAIQIEPGYWKNYLSLGDYYFFNGRYNKAISQYKKVLLLKDNYEPVMNRLGATYFLTDDLQQATNYWSKALAIKPSAEMYTNVGTALFFRHHFEESLISFEKAVKLKPNFADMWANLGDALKYSGQEKKAKQAYQKALQLNLAIEEINQKNIGTKIDHFRYLSELDRCNSVINNLKSIDVQNEKDPYLFYYLAIASLNCNLNDLSKKYINKAVKLGYSKKLLSRDIQFEQLLHSEKEGENNVKKIQ